MKEGDALTIYERIKKRRKELNLSADDVAKALNVSRATVYRYESSDIEKLPITVIEPLSKVLRIPPGQLMGWDKLESEIYDDQVFENFLKSSGYKITVEKVDVSKTGYWEEQKDENGNVIGKVWVPDEEMFAITVSKNGLSVTFSEEEFKKFKQSIKKSVDFEIYRASQNYKQNE